MITKMTPQNELQYQKLFREAEEVLKLHDDYPTENDFEEDKSLLEKWTIGDIYTYFIAFPRILEAAKIKDETAETKVPGDNSYWQKYFSILPLDEPVFSINANTRTISIPSEFKNIGVVGDNTAEIIFFEIDRFFDAVDFGAEQIKAVIEWYRVGKSDEIHADEAYIKELTLKKDKVLIGWVIDKEITEEAGTIEFSLRLYIEKINEDNPEEREIIYSFSTSPAKVNIGKTLNFYGQDLNTIDTNKSSEVLNRILQTASPDLSNENTIASPSFTRVDDSEPDDIKIVSTNIDSVVPPSNVYTKVENAYYVDFDRDTDGDNINDCVTIEGVIARSMSGNNASRLKYQWKRYENGTWLRYPAGSAPATADGDNGVAVTISKVGKYKCEVTDNVGIRFGAADSQILYVLGPEKPKVAIAEDENKYTSMILDPINGVELTVKPKTGNKFYIDDYDAGNQTQLSFKWKKNNDINSENEIDINDANVQTYNAKEEGYYYGYAVTQRNSTTETSDEATTYRVTKRLIEPTSQYTVLGLSNGTMGKLGETIEIQFNTYDADGNIKTSYDYDTIDYQWYRSMNQNEGDSSYEKIEDEEYASGTLQATNRSIFFNPQVAAAYRLKLLVKRNGQSIPEKDFDENDSSTWPMLNQLQTNGTYDELTISISKD